MTSKQEKLAAARRKLKEFQVKNKEADILKEKKLNDVTCRTSKQFSYSFGDSRNSPLLSQGTSPVSLPPHLLSSQREGEGEGGGGGGGEGEGVGLGVGVLGRKISTESNKWPGHYSSASQEKLDDSKLLINFEYSNGLTHKEASNESPNFGSSVKNHLSGDGVYSHSDFKTLDPKDFFNDSSKSGKSGLDEVIKPLQVELENHAQTINILVQQRNEVQNALNQTHALLNKKTGEIEELHEQVVSLRASLSNSNRRLKEMEELSEKVLSEKEENFQKWQEALSKVNQLEVSLETHEEEFVELKRKYEEKWKENERLIFSLQETQSQLSLAQIQAQQFSTEGQTTLALQSCELREENLKLKQKITELEKGLEGERAEKDEASQKFHIYAQQCNIQLANLNGQLKALECENEKLSREKAGWLKSQSESGEEKVASSESYETEIADLHDQISALKEKTNGLEMDLKRKEKESVYLKEELEGKDAELNELETVLRELEKDNKRLLMEVETPKANERLLATMESDKVAAAKAVSQNVKLKEQIVELEKAFMKLSQEKLELTDELAHEKHINCELEKRLKHEESHGHHDHYDECHHEKNDEPLVNDSNEIEELRNIVRQLQDDKMELTARLNAYETNKTERERERTNDENHDPHHEHQHHDHEHDDTDCENAKVRLQQMEEKVRKTMNEIAILDEEKEKLEHLVLQLQGETETIGEYITLYQRQRMLLKQKAQEKDIRLMQLSRDKEELKSKLAALDELVRRLIAEREGITPQPGSKMPSLISPGLQDNTAGKIRALISEIGSTNLIAKESGVFEHCPCCSGRLITI